MHKHHDVNDLVKLYGNQQEVLKLHIQEFEIFIYPKYRVCLLYTSDAADDMQCVDLGGRRIIKKEKTRGSKSKNASYV